MRYVVLILILAALLPVGTPAHAASPCNPRGLVGQQRPMICVYRPYSVVVFATRYCRDQNPAFYLRSARKPGADLVICAYTPAKAVGSLSLPRPARPRLPVGAN